jgi:cytochrome c biogenesis protein CcmG/thiol:disulfide interchange protein DsbE
VSWLLLPCLLLLACATPGRPGGPAASAPESSRQALAQGTVAKGSDEGRRAVQLVLRQFPDETSHPLSVDLGHVLVLDAWATWCAPCVRSLPQLQALQKAFAGRGVRTYAVSVDEDRSQIAPFLAAARVELSVLLDPGGNGLEQSLGLRVMPTTWVLDRSGRVRGVHEGFEGNVDAVRADVEKLLAEPP